MLGRCPRYVVQRRPADARVLGAGTGRPLAGHAPGDNHALCPARFRVSDGHEGDRIPLRNGAYHRSVTGDSCTLKAGIIASTTPVFRSSSTSKPLRPPTLEPAVEASGIHSLRGDSAGVSSTAIELFWFSGSSPQRPPGGLVFGVLATRTPGRKGSALIRNDPDYIDRGSGSGRPPDPKARRASPARLSSLRRSSNGRGHHTGQARR